MIRSESSFSIQKSQTFWAFFVYGFLRFTSAMGLLGSFLACRSEFAPTPEKRAGVRSNAQEFGVTRKGIVGSSMLWNLTRIAIINHIEFENFMVFLPPSKKRHMLAESALRNILDTFQKLRIRLYRC